MNVINTVFRTATFVSGRALALGVLASGALLTATETAAQQIPQTVTIRNFFKVGNDSLAFSRPILTKPYPGEDSAFIVLQQNGRIVTVRWMGTAWRKTDSASVTVLGGTNGNDEQGLLGFAFHPNYAQSRKYYLYFEDGTSGSGGSRFNLLVERTAGESLRPATGDPQRTILRLRDPYDNHNGGTIDFDTEGHLVLGIGDGGTINGDPQNRAQNLDSLHGKFLRFDVNGPDAFPGDTTRNYAIPATNPFAVSGGRPEIWAYGARNPFRWSFHPVTGEIWLGDVGQWDWEEVTRVPKGANLGWRLREGNVCFDPAQDCPSAGLEPPVLVLPHTQASCIIGGAFFVGPVSAFNGTYIFGDFGTSRVWAARVQGDTLANLTEIGSVSRLASFDRDRQGRILASSLGSTATNGRVLVLESPDMVLGPVNLRADRTMRAARTARVKLSDLRAHPEAYEWRGADGRLLATPMTYKGVAFVRAKGSADGKAAPLQPVVLD